MKNGYINGSDILLKVGGRYVGHCTSHTVTFSSETKDRAVKAVGTAAISEALWTDKGVVGLSVSVKADGLRNYNETEGGFKTLLAAYVAAQPVEVECMERESTKPYLKGLFIIDSLEESNGAKEDATYTISLSNTGMPTVFEPADLTGESAE